MHDMADAIYIGGLLNTCPQTYIKLENDEITMVAEGATLRSRLDVTETMTVRKSATFSDALQVQAPHPSEAMRKWAANCVWRQGRVVSSRP